ncbi:hypothetical protein BH11MYX2_BH11MYX2_26040 [soil metagenome]
MKSIRRIHAWLGVLFAPSIILFALSGMFQLYGCHEGEGESEPSSFVVRIAQLHMHQTAQLPSARKPRAEPSATAMPAASAAGEQDGPRAEKQARPATGPLKAFFLAMCLALISSSLGGLYIAFTSKRDRGLHVGLLAAGIVLPIVLIVIA